MRKPFLKPNFMERFTRGMNYYQKGAWKLANEELSHIEGILMKKDPPTRSLLRYMSEFNVEAPITWPGYRTLTDK